MRPLPLLRYMVNLRPPEAARSFPMVANPPAESLMSAVDQGLIQEGVLEMGTRVELMLERTVRALCTGDEGLARQSVVLSRRIEQDRDRLDAMCAERALSRRLDDRAVTELLRLSRSVGVLARISGLALRLCRLSLSMEETGVPGDMERIRGAAALVMRRLGETLLAFRSELESKEASAVRSASELQGSGSCVDGAGGSTPGTAPLRDEGPERVIGETLVLLDTQIHALAALLRAPSQEADRSSHRA